MLEVSFSLFLLFECKQAFMGVLQFQVQLSLQCWRLTTLSDSLQSFQHSDMCISLRPVTNGTYSGQLSPCFPFIFMRSLSCHLQYIRLNWSMQINHYNGVREGSLGAAVP